MMNECNNIGVSVVEFIPKLSKASKMPCESFSLPAGDYCKTGSKLRKVKGSVCYGCYAMKGNYLYKNVKASREHNINIIKSGQWGLWIDNIVWEIKRTNTSGYFRWHDSGDIQNLEHLKAIVEVANRLDGIRFWLPTLEKKIINEAKRDGLNIPQNLTIRLSSPMVNSKPSGAWQNTSTVTTKKDMKITGELCRSYEQGGKCLTCRACWDKEIQNITYLKH